jgi:predicted acyl esterase
MRRISRHAWILILVTGAGAWIAPSFRAAQQMPVDYAQRFDKREAMIAMRDGVKLHTELY